VKLFSHSVIDATHKEVQYHFKRQ